MLMGFKHQLVNVLCPSHLLAVTLNHLDAVTGVVQGNPEAMASLEAAATMTRAWYSAMSMGDWMHARQTLLCFVQGKHEKIMSLLEKKFQNQDGRFVINVDGPVPPGSAVPGTATSTYDRVGLGWVGFIYPLILPSSEAPNTRRREFFSALRPFPRLSGADGRAI